MALTFVFAANHRLKSYALALRADLERLKYDYIAYDLGGLGFGEPLTINDNTFQTLGYYRTNYAMHPSRSMHKPSIVAHSLARINAGSVLVYLDADITLRHDISEIELDDFDIGITVGPGDEAHPRPTRLNAGVAFFRSTMASGAFLSTWEAETAICGNDQQGLQNTVDKNKWAKIWEYPMLIYNCRKFATDPEPSPVTKIVHYMASTRDPAIHRIWEIRARQG
jgi:hypothetical protein